MAGWLENSALNADDSPSEASLPDRALCTRCIAHENMSKMHRIAYLRGCSHRHAHKRTRRHTRQAFGCHQCTQHRARHRARADGLTQVAKAAGKRRRSVPHSTTAKRRWSSGDTRAAASLLLHAWHTGSREAGGQSQVRPPSSGEAPAAAPYPRKRLEQCVEALRCTADRVSDCCRRPAHARLTAFVHSRQRVQQRVTA